MVRWAITTLLFFYVSFSPAFDSNMINGYHKLRVISDDQGLHGGLVTLDADVMPTLQSNATQQTSTLAPLVVREGSSPGQLFACQTAGVETKYCTLQGPSGKGEHRFELATNPHQPEDAIGWEVESKGWTTQQSGEKTLLRYDMSEGSSDRHWIAVPKEEAEGGWEIWWFEPSPANCEDFGRYVKIDLELVAA